MKVSIISFTDRGHAVSTHIANHLPDACVTQYGKAEHFVPYQTIYTFAQRAMAQDDAVIFIGAVGIAVRAAAPYLQGKEKDPAVIVIDENGHFVIPILSGHIGGANRLAQTLANILHAVPVITTATDGRNIFAADSWAAEHNCTVYNIGCIKYISSALLRGETVGLQSDFPISGILPQGVILDTKPENGIQVSIFLQKDMFLHTLHIVPRIVHLGIGCKRNTPPGKLKRWAKQVLQDIHIHICAAASIASIDLKADEPAILQLAQAWGIPAKFYTAQILEQVQGNFPASEFVRKTTGIDNVCQRAAAYASHEGVCILPKTAYDGMTVSVYRENWRILF